MSKKLDLMKARSLQELAQASAAPERGRPAPEQAVEPVDLPISHVWPDPAQPRRAMPDKLRERWCAGENIFNVLTDWEHIASSLLRERGHNLAWEAWLEYDADAAPLPDLSTAHPQLRLWDQLLRLAGSIARDGLAVPVSAYRLLGGYRLLMGERRLLAFLLLTWLGYPGFDHIPAIVVERYDPRQQAIENGVRRDLNAIGIARQLAVLLMDFNTVQIPYRDQPGQEWYAQAYELRVPRGYADALITTLGLANTRQISQYRDLLLLPGPVWNWADEFSWTEGKLRALRAKASSDEELIQLAQGEVARELGASKRIAPSVPQRAARAASRIERALERAIGLDDSLFDAMEDVQKRYLRSLAQDLLKRL